MFYSECTIQQRLTPKAKNDDDVYASLISWRKYTRSLLSKKITLKTYETVDGCGMTVDGYWLIDVE